METTLFLLCPTDCLESKINEEFKGDNLFYTSLANNSSFDSKTIREIEELVNRYSIKEVYFDRGGYIYHGRGKALAESARKEGLKF